MFAQAVGLEVMSRYQTAGLCPFLYGRTAAPV